MKDQHGRVTTIRTELQRKSLSESAEQQTYNSSVWNRPSALRACPAQGVSFFLLSHCASNHSFFFFSVHEFSSLSLFLRLYVLSPHAHSMSSVRSDSPNSRRLRHRRVAPSSLFSLAPAPHGCARCAVHSSSLRMVSARLSRKKLHHFRNHHRVNAKIRFSLGTEIRSSLDILDSPRASGNYVCGLKPPIERQ